MTQTFFIQIMQESLLLVLLLSAPALGAAMIIGLIIGVLQAATQIQEQTLSFVPKIISVFAVLIIFGSWLLNTLVTFTTDLYNQLPGLVR
jgi:flagellar biosynthetic protein FliQ